MSSGNKRSTRCRSTEISVGKCYTFTFENELRFGYNSAGFYAADEESRAQQFGKFQLCNEECCETVTDINPGQGFYIKDLHGEANGGKNCKQWLNNATDGSHITKTPDFAKAGQFSITKWPCGKYCLSGATMGLGPTCPHEMLGATFTTLDDQSCIPMTLTEVPCDIRSAANNCIWITKAKQCGEPPKANCEICNASNATIPVPAADGAQVILNVTQTKA